MARAGHRRVGGGLLSPTVTTFHLVRLRPRARAGRPEFLEPLRLLSGPGSRSQGCASCSPARCATAGSTGPPTWRRRSARGPRCRGARSSPRARALGLDPTDLEALAPARRRPSVRLAPSASSSATTSTSPTPRASPTTPRSSTGPRSSPTTPRCSPLLRDRVPRGVRRRVPGHRPRAGAPAAGLVAPDDVRRRRRPRPVDLHVPRRRRARHPHLPRRLPPTRRLGARSWCCAPRAASARWCATPRAACCAARRSRRCPPEVQRLHRSPACEGAAYGDGVVEVRTFDRESAEAAPSPDLLRRAPTSSRACRGPTWWCSCAAGRSIPSMRARCRPPAYPSRWSVRRGCRSRGAGGRAAAAPARRRGRPWRLGRRDAVATCCSRRWRRRPRPPSPGAVLRCAGLSARTTLRRVPRRRRRCALLVELAADVPTAVLPVEPRPRPVRPMPRAGSAVRRPVVLTCAPRRRAPRHGRGGAGARGRAPAGAGIALAAAASRLRCPAAATPGVGPTPTSTRSWPCSPTAERAEERFGGRRGVANFLAGSTPRSPPTPRREGRAGPSVRLLTAHRAKACSGGSSWSRRPGGRWPDLRRRGSLLPPTASTAPAWSTRRRRSAHAEERRLFYVACTRAQERLWSSRRCGRRSTTAAARVPRPTSPAARATGGHVVAAVPRPLSVPSRRSCAASRSTQVAPRRAAGPRRWRPGGARRRPSDGDRRAGASAHRTAGGRARPDLRPPVPVRPVGEPLASPAASLEGDPRPPALVPRARGQGRSRAPRRLVRSIVHVLADVGGGEVPADPRCSRSIDACGASSGSRRLAVERRAGARRRERCAGSSPGTRARRTFVASEHQFGGRGPRGRVGRAAARVVRPVEVTPTACTSPTSRPPSPSPPATTADPPAARRLPGRGARGRPRPLPDDVLCAAVGLRAPPTGRGRAGARAGCGDAPRIQAQGVQEALPGRRVVGPRRSPTSTAGRGRGSSPAPARSAGSARSAAPARQRRGPGGAPVTHVRPVTRRPGLRRADLRDLLHTVPFSEGADRGHHRAAVAVRRRRGCRLRQDRHD